MKRPMGALKSTFWLSLLIAMISFGLVHADTVLSVNALQGKATVLRNGITTPLTAGQPLFKGDVVAVGPDSDLNLNMASYGFLQLGANTTLAVKRLPYASFAPNLKTVFALSNGYLRVVWKYPLWAADWPLEIDFAGKQNRLTDGEFFFQRKSTGQYLCIAAGVLTISATDSGHSMELKPSACYRITLGMPSHAVTVSQTQWIAIRGAFQIPPMAIARTASATGERVIPPATTSLISSSEKQAPRNTPQVKGVNPVAATLAPRQTSEPVAGGSSKKSSGPIIHTNPMASEKYMRPRILRIPKPANTVAHEHKKAEAPHLTHARQQPPILANPTNHENWAVNIGSWEDVKGAEVERMNLRRKGYPVVMAPTLIKGKRWYRVQLQGFSSKQAAQSAARRLHETLGYNGLWVLQSGH